MSKDLTPFPYKEESRRLADLIRTRGFEVLEDLLLASEMAVLDVALENEPPLRGSILRYHRTVGRAKCDLHRARVVHDLK